MTSPEQLMTQEEVAFRWKISEATLERDRSLKQGCRYLKLGGLIRYRLQDVVEYENACANEPAKKLREKNSAPPQRQPLTEDQIDDIWNRYCDEMGEASINDAYDIARAIERAHGIGGGE
jgi:hypothetical protein